MMIALALSVVLSAAPDDEGRGGVGTLPEIARAQRTAPRLRAGLGGLVVFGYSNYRPSGGLGLAFDLGATFNDRVALFLHGEVASAVATFHASGGVAAEYVMTEHVSMGLGVSLTGWVPTIYTGYSDGFFGLLFPVRLRFALEPRPDAQTSRRGFSFGLELAGGFSLQPTYFYQLQAPLPPDGAFTAAATFGYAMW